MGIAKSAEQVKIMEAGSPQPVIDHNTEGALINNLPLDIYRVFNEDIVNIKEKDVDKLTDIFEWAKRKCEEPTIGNIISVISNLENKLGAPALNEKRYYKMWRYVKLSKHIDDLDKEREALKRQWAF